MYNLPSQRTVEQRLEQIRTAAKAERTRTTAEVSAFTTFQRRIQRLTAGSPGRSGVIGAARPDQGASMTAITDAYAETVMATDHYESMYDEVTPVDAIRAEFGPEIGDAVAANDTLTPTIKQALYDAATASREYRSNAAEALTDEAAYIAEACPKVMNLVKQAHSLADTIPSGNTGATDARALDAYRRRARAIRETAVELANDRQQHRQELVINPEALGEVIPYIYRSLEWDYPLVHLLAEVVEGAYSLYTHCTVKCHNHQPKNGQQV